MQGYSLVFLTDFGSVIKGPIFRCSSWNVCVSNPVQVIRYNRLLGVIHSSLKDLKKALKGLVVMSQTLETMFNSLYNNTVPELWAAKVNSSRGRPLLIRTL